MTNLKTTKRALLSSVIALLVCFTMLLGTTFAWFTDSVTSAGNIIQTGTLDVEMYWAYGTEAPDSATWTDASTGAIFNYDKWEPGYVEVRHIKIANVGTLALKYQIKIVANGEVSDLADVIDVYYVDPAQQIADRTDLTDDNKLGTLTDVLANLANTANGELPAGENDTITLALKMQEDAGNEYQNKSIGSSFSIQLLATQLTSEEDSFDDQYDFDASYTAETDAFKTALAAAEAGDTVTLNLTHDAYLGAGESIIAPEGVDMVINGNGHTIFADGATHVIAGKRDCDITINDLTIVGKTKDDAIISQNNGVGGVNIVMNNVKVNLTDIKGVNWPVCLGGNGTATLTNCEITGAGIESGDYADGNQFFAGAQMNVTFVNTKIDSVMLNGSQGGNSATLNIDAASKIGVIILEAKTTSVISGNATGIKDILIPGVSEQEANQIVANEAKAAIAAGGDVTLVGTIDMGGETVAIPTGTVITGGTISNVLLTSADDNTVSFKDVKFTDAVTIQAKGDGSLSFVDCKFDIAPKKYSGRGSAILGENQYYTLDLYLDGCTFNYTPGGEDLWTNAIFMWTGVNKCTIKNCTFNDYGFVAVKLMNAADGAEIVFEGNTFNMSKQGDANWYNNNAIQIVPQHDKAITTKFINNVFNGDFEDDNIIAMIEVMHGGTLSNLTFEQSGNTINGAAVTDANFAIKAN